MGAVAGSAFILGAFVGGWLVWLSGPNYKQAPGDAVASSNAAAPPSSRAPLISRQITLDDLGIKRELADLVKASAEGMEVKGPPTVQFLVSVGFGIYVTDVKAIWQSPDGTVETKISAAEAGRYILDRLARRGVIPAGAQGAGTEFVAKTGNGPISLLITWKQTAEDPSSAKLAPAVAEAARP